MCLFHIRKFPNVELNARSLTLMRILDVFHLYISLIATGPTHHTSVTVPSYLQYAAQPHES